MHLRIHDPGACALSIASAVTPAFGVGPDTWRWFGSLLVSIAGIIAAIVIHIHGRAAEERRRQDLLDLEQRMILRQLAAASPPLSPSAP
jgi:hypothetical protein